MLLKMDQGPAEVAWMEESDGSDDPEDSEVDWESEDGGAGFLLALEADEESDDSEDSYDEDAENIYWNGEDSDSDAGSKGSGTFEIFGNLPPELRQYIWKLAGLSLEEPRILQFRIYPTTENRLDAGDGLPFQTRLARTLSLVNREARETIVKTLPDTLQFDRHNGKQGFVRFDKGRDVVMVDGYGEVNSANTFSLDGFAENVRQLAVNCWDFSSDVELGERFMPFLDRFPNVKRLFVAGPDEEFGMSDRDRLWCGSDFVHTFDFSFLEGYISLVDRRRIRICWPNADEYDDWAKNEVPTYHFNNLSDGVQAELSKRGIENWPMLAFEDKSGFMRFNLLQQKWEKSLGDVRLKFDGEEDDDDDGSSNGDDSDASDGFLDEYEEDFIDDAEDLTGQTGLSHADETGELSGDEVFDDEEASDDERNTRAEAHFSSPEPDNEDDAKPMVRSRKRQIVTDSDDESVAENTRGKRARTNRTVLSDSEDDDEGGVVHSGTTNRGAATSESKSDKKMSRTKRAVVEDDESESESADSSSEEEEEAPPKRMSLAEKLKIARDAHPVSSEDEDSENEDDDELDEDEDDEDEDSDGGLIDGIAEESDDGDEDEDDY